MTMTNSAKAFKFGALMMISGKEGHVLRNSFTTAKMRKIATQETTAKMAVTGKVKQTVRLDEL